MASEHYRLSLLGGMNSPAVDNAKNANKTPVRYETGQVPLEARIPTKVKRQHFACGFYSSLAPDMDYRRLFYFFALWGSNPLPPFNKTKNTLTGASCFIGGEIGMDCAPLRCSLFIRLTPHRRTSVRLSFVAEPQVRDKTYN